MQCTLTDACHMVVELCVWPLFLIIDHRVTRAAKKCFSRLYLHFWSVDAACMAFLKFIISWHRQPRKCSCRFYLHFWSINAACMAFFFFFLPLDMGSHKNVSVDFISISGVWICMYGFFLLPLWHGQPQKIFFRFYLHFWCMDAATQVADHGWR